MSEKTQSFRVTWWPARAKFKYNVYENGGTHRIIGMYGMIVIQPRWTARDLNLLPLGWLDLDNVGFMVSQDFFDNATIRDCEVLRTWNIGQEVALLGELIRPSMAVVDIPSDIASADAILFIEKATAVGQHYHLPHTPAQTTIKGTDSSWLYTPPPPPSLVAKIESSDIELCRTGLHNEGEHTCFKCGSDLLVGPTSKYCNTCGI